MKKTIRRRRHEKKTDYKARLALLKSEKPRLVVRKTNRYVVVQIVQTEIAQDKVLFGLSSKDLLAKGWPKDKAGSLKSLPAAYATGYAVGKMAQGKVKKAILDIGMNRNIQKSRLYAALKGAIDAGLEIPASETALPSEEEINKDENLAKILSSIKSKL